MEEGYIGKTSISIYGRDNDLGETIQFTVPEGAEVSKPVKVDNYSREYKVTVKNGEQTKEYSIYYYRDVEQFKLNNITDESNKITYRKSVYQGDDEGYVYITGSNPELGESLQAEAAEGLSVEIVYAQKNEDGCYEFADGDTKAYPAKIVVKNGDATFCYYVYYEAESTAE